MHQVERLIGRKALVVLLLGLVVGLGAWRPFRASGTTPGWAGPVASASAQEPVRPSQEVRLTARKYAFSPDCIEVEENDLVKITLEAADIPHSFTIDDDHYRIAKRATPDHPAVFEFRADKAGTFTFYCNLTADPGCKSMRGALVVRPKR